jgi:hypothetical protein
MRVTSYTFDLAKCLAGIGGLLLALGVLPFTAGWVGALVILAATTLEFKWSA